jgi:hypothetical protein
MEIGVRLQEMVVAAITRDLELGPDTERCAGGFGLADGLEDAFLVASEVESPLV